MTPSMLPPVPNIRAIRYNAERPLKLSLAPISGVVIVVGKIYDGTKLYRNNFMKIYGNYYFDLTFYCKMLFIAIFSPIALYGCIPYGQPATIIVAL